MTEKKSEPWDWARKHTQLKSDPIIKMVNDSPEKFMISRTEIIQLVLDLQTMKNRFLNMAIWQSVTDEWIDKPEEEKQAERAEMKAIEDQIKRMFDNYEPPKNL